MRKIKFRGRDNNGQWHIGFLADEVEDGNYLVILIDLLDKDGYKPNLGENRGDSFNEEDFSEFYEVVGNTYDNPELLKGEIE